MEYDTASHSMQCPKCRHGMEEVTHEGITIDRCTNCRGLWFDQDEMVQLKAVKDGHLVDIGDAKIGWKWDSLADINCPRCGKEMDKSADPVQKHIWYEVCIEHGVFMDAGEFKDYKFESLLDRFRSLIKGDRKYIAP
jgi:Zn-finger nucleic acid-binding protein